MGKLSQDQISEAVAGLSGWAQTGDEIGKQFEFEDFVGSMAFVNRVADAAEAADHHPDIDIRYNKVKIALSTHSEGGITDKDVALARQIESLAG